MKKNFREWMKEEQAINRWMVVEIAIFGGFCGALLAVTFMISGLV